MNIFSTRDEAYHRDQKRLFAAAYSMSSLLEMEDAVDSCANVFVKRLDEFVAGGTAFDFGVSKLVSAFVSVASYVETVTRPGSNTMLSTSLASSLSVKSSASSNEAVTWTVLWEQ